MTTNGSQSFVAAVDAKPSRVPVLALDVSEACAALGISWDHFSEYVAPEIKIVRSGRRKLIAVTELQRWLDDNGERLGV